MLDVSKALSNPGAGIPFEMPLEFEPTFFMGETLGFENALVSGVMTGGIDMVSVNSRLRVTVKAHCSLCLEATDLDMDVPVDCVFAREEGDETYPLEGYRADISRAAFEALLSELPMRFVCREDCKGLCPVCGRNRNTNPCDCLEGARGPRPLEALSVLLHNNNEEV